MKILMLCIFRRKKKCYISYQIDIKKLTFLWENYTFCPEISSDFDFWFLNKILLVMVYEFFIIKFLIFEKIFDQSKILIFFLKFIF